LYWRGGEGKASFVLINEVSKSLIEGVLGEGGRARSSIIIEAPKGNERALAIEVEMEGRYKTITIPALSQPVTSHPRAGIANLSNRRSKWSMYACQYGSSSTKGHGRQGDFKGPVQHEAGGQKCSTWRPNCSVVLSV
jgi:hypothetical protein